MAKIELLPSRAAAYLVGHDDDDYAVRTRIDALTFSDVATAAAAIIPDHVTAIYTQGYDDASPYIGGGRYKRSSSGAVAAFPSEASFISSDGSYWLLDERLATPQMFGVIPHATNDNTSGLQAFINYLCALFDEVAVVSAGKGVIPKGIYRFTTLTISKPVDIEGDGPNGTLLKQIAGHTTSAIKVRCAYSAYDYYTQLTIPADVKLSNLRILGGDQLLGLTNQHGIDLQNAGTTPVTTRVVLNNVRVKRFCGHGIYGLSWSGWVEGHGVQCSNNTLDGLHANSCSDWRFVASNFFVNTRHGMTLSGSNIFNFVSCNAWANAQSGVVIYNATSGQYVYHVFVGGTVDRNDVDGVAVTLTDIRATVHFIGTQIFLNSRGSSGVYSEISLSSATTGTVKCTSVQFGRCLSQAVTADDKSLTHIRYDGSGGVVEVDSSCTFAGGALLENIQRATAVFGANAEVSRTLTAQRVLVGGSAVASARNIDVQAAAGYNRAIRFLSGANQTYEFGSAATTGDLYLNRHNPASGAFIDTPLRVDSATGVSYFTSALVAEGGIITGTTTAPVVRYVDLKNAAGFDRALRYFSGTFLTYELGSAATLGDFYINRYNPASGVYINTPMRIDSATGLMTLTATLRIIGLPTSNPGGSGLVWNDAGTLKIT